MNFNGFAPMFPELARLFVNETASKDRTRRMDSIQMKNNTNLVHLIRWETNVIFLKFIVQSKLGR